MILGVVRAHELVENVVISLDLQLEGNTGLLQKVGLDIGGGNFVGGAEVDTDELTLWTKNKTCSPSLTDPFIYFQGS